MARPKDSTAMQLLKGVDKKDPGRVNHDEPDSGELNGAPDFLTDDELLWWNTMIEKTASGVLQNSDYMSMILLAREMARYVRDPDSFTASDKNILRGMFGEFGMTPATRRNIKIKTKEKKSNPFESL